MSATPEELRATLSDLGVSVWTSTAIGVLYESGLVDHLREARSASELTAFCPGLSAQRIERCLAVAAAAGLVVTEGGNYRLAEAAFPFVQEPMRSAMRGDIRTTLMQALALLDSCSAKQPTAGWRHTDRALLQSQGEASAALAPMIKARVAPALDGLAARLDAPGAGFLDVGVGVAALSIAMCRVFAELQVVGLDTYGAPLEIARENVARTGLSARIELRQTATEALADKDAYDLAWVPSFFIPPGALGAGLARVRAALRPGGWVLLGIAAMGDDRQRAARLLVNELWAGAVLSPQQGETLLQEAGFSVVRTLPGPAWAASFVVGQR